MDTPFTRICALQVKAAHFWWPLQSLCAAFGVDYYLCRNILFDTGHLSITNRAITIFHTIERWVDVNASDHTGQTALHWSAVQGAVQVAEILLQEGASVGAADMYGYQVTIWWAGLMRGVVYGPRLQSCNEMDELLEGAVEDSFVGSLGPERSLFANEPPLGYLD
ncbi:hypothetical protein DCAR_0313116 [Daucus carota subsp. sativus]|uniref:Uncharacterized protein n=1 Tax=Daucus carota subsp. sativus TaxID=79200 RepID=A0A166BTJ4_DAUCS|nr:hypothetical protein DCAR_0313116 [Daucus carota subsp. sativus]